MIGQSFELFGQLSVSQPVYKPVSQLSLDRLCPQQHVLSAIARKERNLTMLGNAGITPLCSQLQVARRKKNNKKRRRTPRTKQMNLFICICIILYNNIKLKHQLFQWSNAN